MGKSGNKGNEAEDHAVDYLSSKGYKILERNYRFKRAEVDIIVQKDELLIFCEVKLRSNQSFGHPETFLSEAQTQRILEAAEAYQIEVGWKQNIRFDVIAIIESQNGLEIDHFKDAFY